MHIVITTHGCPYHREIEHMTGLFFEYVEITFSSSDDISGIAGADLTIELDLQHNGTSLIANGALFGKNGRRTATRHKTLAPEPDAKTLRKYSKRIVMHTLHELLRAETETHQPWGILTGIRPLKLVHQMHQQSRSKADIAQELGTEYLVAPERVNLLLEIAEVQRHVVPDLYQLDHGVSLYIGIPFCPTHCAYCTFPAYSMQEKATYVDDFLRAMDLEFAHLGGLLRAFSIPVTSVYVGGGTPTSLRAQELEHMFETIYREIPFPDKWRELTVEAGRPDTITPDRVKVMKAYGVQRISVNPQTFKADTLKEIGRGHTPDIVDHRFHYVRDAGFENINMDMILGLPGESLDDVRYTMERITRLDPDSVTIHTMSFKRTAVVKTEKERFKIPHSEVVRQMMAESAAWARSLGQHPYYVYRQKDILGNLENIGFSKPGKESIYNIAIMEERQAIVGIGGGAVSKLIGPGGIHAGRFANPREPKAYVETIHQVIERKDRVLRPLLKSIADNRPTAVPETLHASASSTD